MQKPPFCTPKTILLQRKNHTFVWRICNVQITNTLRTFREHPTNTHEITHEHSAKYTHSPTKHPRTTPPGVGDRFIVPVSLYYQIHIFVSPNTYLTIIEYTYSFHHTRVFTLSNMRFHSSFRGCLRICGHDKSAPTAANGLPFRC